jgi:putative ABC transport system substrate-binding protein
MLSIQAAALIPFVNAGDKKVAIMWVGKSAMTKRVMLGFTREVKKIAPNLQISRSIETASMSEAEGKFRTFEETMDAIVFLRSNGAKYLAKLDHPPRVPCFVGGCNNPAFLGAVKNLEAPEGNITGVTYFIPFEKRFDVIKKLFPNVKSVGLLLEKGHPGSAIDRQGTRQQCEKWGIEYHEVVAKNASELLSGVKEIIDKIDLLILSSTAVVMDSATALLVHTNPAKKPIFSYSEKPANFAAVAALASRDQYLGALLAQSVVDVVVKGKPVSQAPVKMDPEPRLVVNVKMMNALGLELPGKLIANAKLIK